MHTSRSPFHGREHSGPSRMTGLLLLGLLSLVIAAAPASAAYTGYAAPRIAYETLGTPDYVRALSLCIDTDRVIGAKVPLTLEAADFQGTLVIEVTPGTQPPPNLRLVVTDVGAAQVVEQTPTRLVVEGFYFDFNVVFDGTGTRADGVGDALHVATFCDPNGVCTQARTHIVFSEDTSTVVTTLCDAPPLLVPADDNGVRADDDYTSAQPLRFTVASTAPTVTLLRDGAAIATQPVAAGTATLEDTSAPDFALHAYQVRHGAGVPSAARFIERHVPPGAPAALAVLSADQVTPVQQPFPAALRARVTDANGLGVPNVAAMLTVVPGASGATATFPGGAASYTGVTDALGEFTAPTLTAGSVAGAFDVRLTRAGVADAQAPMRVAAGPVTSIELLSGSLQQADVGETFERPLRVRVRDAFGNAAAGANVAFVAPPGAPSALMIPGNSTTLTRNADAAGEVSMQVRAAFGPGGYEVRAASNGQAVFFALENLVAPPAGIEATTDTTLVLQQPGSSVTPPPTVRVVDHLQQPMPGIRVTFTQVAGDAVLSGTQPLTDANGIASLGAWQLGAQDTLSRIEAKVFGLEPVVFSARTRTEVDVAVSVDNATDVLEPGARATWTVTVSNAGPGPARATALLLDGDGIAPRAWRCVAAAPSACSTTSGGAAWPALVLEIAPGQTVSVEIDADVIAPADGEAGLGAGVMLAPDSVDASPGNDAAEDVDPVVARALRVFADGFESGG